MQTEIKVWQIDLHLTTASLLVVEVGWTGIKEESDMHAAHIRNLCATHKAWNGTGYWKHYLQEDIPSCILNKCKEIFC